MNENAETLKTGSSDTHGFRHGLRSVGAVLAGLVTVIIVSLATDIVLHATGVFPPWFQPMSTPLWVLALGYRIIYQVAGGYIVARLAPDRPMRHVLILAFIGLALSIIGTAANWNRGPEFGPKWYPLALVVSAIPTPWLGGKLAARRAPEYLN